MGKILFVERDTEYTDPMNVELLSALAKRAGHATFLTVLSRDDLRADLRRIRPDVAAFSVKTGEHTEYARAVAAVRAEAPGVKIVVGGPHPTFFPGLVWKWPVDAVGVGECDDAWLALLGAWAAGRPGDDIPNVVTLENANRTLRPAKAAGGFDAGGYEVSPAWLKPRRTFLDDLPFLDRELVYRKAPNMARWPMRDIMASRGCPFTCTYCFEPKFNALYAGKGPVYNRYSVPRICAELAELKERWGMQFVKFYDDMFLIQKKVDPWLAEFAEVYPREVGVPFGCLTRCNVLTEETLAALKRAGLCSVTMSIEAGNEHVRNHVIKRRMTEKQILDAYHMCEREGIATFANTILGIPVPAAKMREQGRRALDYDIESVDINIAARATYSDFPTLFPYPGSEVAEYVTEHGFFDGDFDRLFHSYHVGSPFACFTDGERLAQKNLSLLGPLCVKYHRARWLRNATVRWLIHLPLTKLYFVPWYVLGKAHLSHWKINPMRIPWRRRIVDLWNGFRLEYRRRAAPWRLFRRATRTAAAPAPPTTYAEAARD